MYTYQLKIENGRFLSRTGTLTGPRLIDATEPGLCRFPTCRDAQRAREAWADHQRSVGYKATALSFRLASVEVEAHTDDKAIHEAWADLNATALYLLPLYIEDAPSYMLKVAEGVGA